MVVGLNVRGSQIERIGLDADPHAMAEDFVWALGAHGELYPGASAVLSCVEGHQLVVFGRDPVPGGRQLITCHPRIKAPTRARPVNAQRIARRRVPVTLRLDTPRSAP